jgi:hypothetical protein
MLVAFLVVLILLLLWLGRSAKSEWIRDAHFMLATLLAITLALRLHGVMSL